jgi:hypothetical protein
VGLPGPNGRTEDRRDRHHNADVQIIRTEWLLTPAADDTEHDNKESDHGIGTGGLFDR